MSITHPVSLMVTRNRWLEMTICVCRVHRFIWVQAIAGWRSRREESRQKLMVTTSNHVLVDMAEFGDDVEIEGDVLAAKRSHEVDDRSGGESDGALKHRHRLTLMLMLCPRSTDAKGLTTNQDKPPRKKKPLAFIQLSPALQPDLKRS